MPCLSMKCPSGSLCEATYLSQHLYLFPRETGQMRSSTPQSRAVRECGRMPSRQAMRPYLLQSRRLPSVASKMGVRRRFRFFLFVWAFSACSLLQKRDHDNDRKRGLIIAYINEKIKPTY